MQWTWLPLKDEGNSVFMIFITPKWKKIIQTVIIQFAELFFSEWISIWHDKHILMRLWIKVISDWIKSQVCDSNYAIYTFETWNHYVALLFIGSCISFTLLIPKIMQFRRKNINNCIYINRMGITVRKYFIWGCNLLVLWLQIMAPLMICSDTECHRKTYDLHPKMTILSSYPLILKRDNWSYLKICGALTISNDLSSRLQKVNEAVLRYHDT